MFKKILLVLAALLLLAAGYIAHEWNGKPFSINNFFNRVALKMALESPEALTSIRLLEQFGIDGHNAELDDASPESTVRMFDYLKQEYEVLKSYDDEDLDKEEILSKRIAGYLFEVMLEMEPYIYYNYPVNQLFGVQNQFPTFMVSMHQINNETDAEYYIQRLNKLPGKFSQVLDGIKLRTQNDIIPPRFVIDRVVDEMTKFTETPVEDNILFKNFKEKLEKLDSLDATRKQDLINKAREIVLEQVYPAYTEMTQYFKGLEDKADERDGFWKLPNGEEVYRLQVKFNTTTDYPPEQIHNIGISEVERIQSEMLVILEQEGYEVSQGFYAAIQQLSSDEKFYYPDTDEGRKQILKDYQSIIDEIDAGMKVAFNKRPEAKVEVERIPEFKEKTSPGAYYNMPAMDGSRPGIFYANLYDIKATPKYSMRTLAYHEAIPGHHYQVALALELEGLPLFRRMGPYTAYLEGWALYAEKVAWEMGFQDDPFDNLGRLQAELFRAVRLVVDTGIHAKRWSREDAIEYMLKNTGMAESDVTAEIERYIVMPGQALAYKVGMMKILELREKAKTQLKDKFNLPDFHDVVLQNGPLPLNILEELVDEYIARNLTEVESTAQE